MINDDTVNTVTSHQKTFQYRQKPLAEHFVKWVKEVVK